MYTKTIFLCFTMMAIASHAKVSCPQGLQANSIANTPTNIISSKAVPANTTTPVILFNGVLNFLRLKNLGIGVEGYPNEAVDKTFVTGGVLCNKVYKLNRVRFLMNPKYGRSGSTTDGKGTPLEVEIIYYNIKYGSFEKALNYPDGVLLITFQIKIGLIPNILFYPLQFFLSLGVIKEPGSQFFLPSAVVYIWFDVISFITEYYALPGSFLDYSSGKTYSALRIIPTPTLAFISYNQFNAFKNILGFNGEPLSTKQQLYPLGSRTLVKGTGFGQVLIPF